MAHLPSDLARSVVLRHFPRVLRAGLDPDGRNAMVSAELVRDLTAIQTGLGPIAKRWLAAQSMTLVPRSETKGYRLASWVKSILRLLRIDGGRNSDRPASPGPEGLAALDAYAADRDDATVRETA